MKLTDQNPNFKVIQTLAAKERLKVYLVGGYLRDYLLGRSKLDYDFAVSKNALKLSRAFARSIKGSYVLLDKERGCARVCKKSAQGLATYDFADFRAKTFKADLGHRDFTINALAVAIEDLEKAASLEKFIMDEKNGRKDLSKKTLRLVSPKAFKDDPLRILRAYSLRAQLGFKIERGTLAQLKKDRERLRGVSYERIRDELFKILATDRAGSILKEMSAAGVLEIIIPQVRLMHNCHQGTYHHLDVWPHSLETVSQLDKVLAEVKEPEVRAYISEVLAGERTRFAAMKLAALLHDIGKPETRRLEEDKRISFHGHEHVGKRIVRVIARELKISKRERFVIEDIVRWHLRPGYLSNFKRPGERAIYRFFRDTKEEAVSTLLVSLADQRSTRGPATSEYDQKHHEQICRSLIREYFRKRDEKPLERLITGHDIIRELRLKPSPLFSRILTAVQEKQTLGEITTKEQALELAKKIANE